MKRLIFVAAAVLLVSTNAGAALSPAGAARLAAAARVAQVIGNTIPGDYWRRAHCVVVVPEVRKTAFIVGGEYGKGVMSCRSAAGWGAPVFMQLAKGSWGVQFGAEQIDAPGLLEFLVAQGGDLVGCAVGVGHFLKP